MTTWKGPREHGRQRTVLKRCPVETRRRWENKTSGEPGWDLNPVRQKKTPKST